MKKIFKYLHQFFCDHDFKETDYYPYPPDMYVIYTCKECGKTKSQDL